MAADPIYFSTPKATEATLSAANTNRDGTTGTYVPICTAGANGSQVYRIIVMATGTTTAGVIRLFRSSDGGTTKHLFEEILVDARTPSTTLAAWSGESRKVSYQKPMLLAGAGTNDQLFASTNNAEGFRVLVDSADA